MRKLWFNPANKCIIDLGTYYRDTVAQEKVLPIVFAYLTVIHIPKIKRYVKF